MTVFIEQIIKSRDKAFLDNLQKAIEHHRTAPDPHGIANAVICALSEVQTAYAKAVEDNPTMFPDSAFDVDWGGRGQTTTTPPASE